MSLPRPLRFAAPAFALAGLLGMPAPASAAWDNVFQVTCNDCNRPRASFFAPAPAPSNCDTCAPQQRSSYKIDYQQRSFYEPITVMKPEKYLEPVEVRSKSFYWEPVTSYCYSSFYDPCSQSCQQVATPRTSYKLKEQCNTSYRYVERIRMVPTQSQRLVTENTPVVTYYGPTTRSYSAPELCPPGSAAPRVDELRAPPTISPSTDGGATIPPPGVPTSPSMSNPRSFPPPARPIAGKVDARTTGRSAAGAVRGEVVLNDRVTPRPNARLVFVNANNYEQREYITADEFGNFDASLPAGEWFLYVGNGQGKAVQHSEKPIAVGEHEAREFRLVSR